MSTFNSFHFPQKASQRAKRVQTTDLDKIPNMPSRWHRMLNQISDRRKKVNAKQQQQQKQTQTIKILNMWIAPKFQQKEKKMKKPPHAQAKFAAPQKSNSFMKICKQTKRRENSANIWAKNYGTITNSCLGKQRKKLRKREIERERDCWQPTNCCF